MRTTDEGEDGGKKGGGNHTFWQVRGHVRHFLGVDVRPVKVIVGVLLVVALGEPLVERAAAWNRIRDRRQLVGEFLWR